MTYYNIDLLEDFKPFRSSNIKRIPARYLSIYGKQLF